jgi:hypothetical protein
VKAQGVVKGEWLQFGAIARVQDLYPGPDSDDTEAWFATLAYGGHKMTVNLSAAAVTLTRLAPEHWPPLDGDVWEDRAGTEWFCTVLFDDSLGGTAALLVCSHDGREYRRYAEGLLARHGPLRLTRRRGWTAAQLAAAGTDLVLTGGQVLGEIWRAVAQDGLDCPRSLEIHLGLVQLAFGPGDTEAVDRWAAHLRLGRPERVGRAVGAPPWQLYQASAGRYLSASAFADDAAHAWPGWRVAVWCPVAAEGGQVAALPPAGPDDTLVDALPGGPLVPGPPGGEA